MKNDKNYVRQNATALTNNAIGFVKDYPCCICINEKGGCSFKYKGTCPVYLNLKIALINVKPIKEIK